MIRCTIVETTSQDGQAASRVARAIVSETLSLGRGAACRIYLPDPRVRLEHATIQRAEDGYLYIQGTGGAVQVDGDPQDLIRLATGQAILIGPFEFVVAEIAHGPGCPQVLLTLNFTHKPVEQVRADAAQSAGGLRRSLLSLRTLSWSAALLCMLFLVALPVWQAYQPKERNTAAEMTGLDVFWNPGQLSSAHKTIGNQCKNCHTQPFQRVKDTACVACHKDAGPHIAGHADLQAQTFSSQRCATCHREHQGDDGMKKVDAISCESCHANVKAYAPSSKLQNVGDFGHEHPEFRLSMRVGPQPLAVASVERTPGLKESSGLKFPHDVHLAPKGIKSPNGPASTGGRVVLECSNCHQIDSAGVRYQPIRMDRDCGACHRLGVDAQNPTRQVPHAPPQAVVAALRDQFAALALEQNPSQVVTVNSLLQGPQIQAAVASNTPAARWVNDRTQAAAKDMFENPKGTCQTCHTIARMAETTPETAGAPWKVQPVLSTEHWLPKAGFSHAQHANASCVSCHAATNSKSSADILIPAIKTCRNCHTGTNTRDSNITRPDKVVSQCYSCHRFHSPVVHASFAADKARVARAEKTGAQP